MQDNMVYQRVAIFLPDLTGGGAERVMLNLAGGLAAKGVPVDLVLARAKGIFLDKLPSGVRLIDLKARHTMTSLPKLVKYLKAEKIGVLIPALHQAAVIGVFAKKFTSVRVGVSVHNTLSAEMKGAHKLRHFIMPALIRIAYPKADAILCCSRGSADDLASVLGISRDRVDYIYNPSVSPELFELAKVPPSHPFFEMDVPVVLAVGKLHPQKDYETMIHAFRMVRSEIDSRLIILGEGSLRPELELLVSELDLTNDVALPGFHSNPFSFMAHAAVFCMSSRWEGLPTVMIEALAVGCAVVSCDCPSGPSEILKDGMYGLLVPVADASALSEALIQALRSPAAKPSAESWEPYTVEKSAQAFIEKLILVAPSP